MVKEIPFDIQAAEAALSKTDAVLARVMEEHGPCSWKISPIDSVFEVLLRAIVYQQLSTKAAATIHGRLKALFDDEITPEQLLALPDETLRGAGLSRPKVSYARHLAERSAEIPGSKELVNMSDREIHDALISLKGIGRWSIEMLLMFSLGRPDVWPVTDLGVRKGFKIAFDMEELPDPKWLEERAEIWKPYRSVVSWYMWRIVEGPNDEW